MFPGEVHWQAEVKEVSSAVQVADDDSYLQYEHSDEHCEHGSQSRSDSCHCALPLQAQSLVQSLVIKSSSHVPGVVSPFIHTGGF